MTAIAPPSIAPSDPSGSADSGYSSVNAASGPSTGEPVVVSASPPSSGDGFDWGSALVGAGAALAFAALGAAALLTVRRRDPVSPTVSQGRPRPRKTRRFQRVPLEAADGIRTHDLLHGN